MNELSAKFPRVRFLVVYISEAHACDEWPLGNFTHIKQHRTAADRIAAARVLHDKYKLSLPMLIDDLDNNFDKTFSAWP